MEGERGSLLGRGFSLDYYASKLNYITDILVIKYIGMLGWGARVQEGSFISYPTLCVRVEIGLVLYQRQWRQYQMLC